MSPLEHPLRAGSRLALVAPFLLVAACAAAATSSPPTVASASSPGPAASVPSTATPPSIVVVLTDDMRFDALGVTGHPYLETPNIDRLAREGVVFDNAFVITAMCCPSRATLLSGLYTHRSGVPANTLDFDYGNVALVPDLLRQRGYATGFVGKYHLGAGTELEGKRREPFDHWVGYPGPVEYVDGTLVINDVQVESRGYSADVLAEYAATWLREQGGRPFFLLLALKNPHAPLTPAPRHAALYSDATMPWPAGLHDPFDDQPAFVRNRITKEERALRDGRTDLQALYREYARMVPSIDDAVGHIMTTLKETGALDRTLVLFTSDNGLMMGEHGLIGKGLPYDTSLRVPLMARLPGRIPAGTRVTEQVINTDIAPTLLDLAGAEVPAAMTGKSLLPLVDGTAPAWRDDWLMIDTFRPGQRPDHLGVRGNRWKYVRYVENSVEEQLFDLQADPDERQNLAETPAHAGELQRQRERLVALMAREKVPADWFDAAPASPPSRPPNVVIILADDLRADALGHAGHPFIETPNIDRLAREGVVFDNAFVITAVCCPSRATLISGLYTHRSGVPMAGEDLDYENAALMPGLLQQHGYATGFIGKYHLGAGKASSPRPIFDHWVSYGWRDTDYVDAQLRVGRERVQTTGYSTDVLADHAVEWLGARGDEPFFLLLAPKTPHAPLTPPERHRDLYKDATPPEPAGFRTPFDELPTALLEELASREHALRDGELDVQELARNYARMVPSLDDLVGRVVETLEKTGALDRTLVLFTSDNGRLLGEHGLLRKGIAYEPSMRVPLIARLPGRIAAGSTISEPALNLDIAPTVLELAGVETPPEMSGRSLLPLLDRKEVAWREDWLFLDGYPPEERPDFLAVRGERWKYVHYVAAGVEEQLFDLQADPDELSNLAGDPAHAAELRRQRQRLAALMAEEEVPESWLEPKTAEEKAPKNAPGSETPETPPSIVIVLADDLRADTLGVTGHPYVETPHIDRLAREGVVFENAFAITAVCSPSRATLLSGLYPHRNGVSANELDFEGEDVVILPDLLKQRGYATGFVGKYHLGKTGTRRDAFDYWVSYDGGQGSYFDAPMVVGDMSTEVEGYSADVLGDYATKWLRERGNTPFFLLLALKNVHVPLTPAPRHAELFRDATMPVPVSFNDPYELLPAAMRRRSADREERLLVRGDRRDPDALTEYVREYARMVPSIDDVMGRLDDVLRETGARERTLVLFTSDNGRLLGEHGLIRKGLAYDPSMRVPLIARLPGRIRPGTTIDEQVLNVDLAPTILDLVGIDAPSGMTGRSLLPLLDGSDAPWREDWLFLTTYLRGRRPSFLAVRGMRWKYVRYLTDGVEEQLFDLQADPDERENLAGVPAHADDLERLRRRLVALMEQEGVPAGWVEAKPPRERDTPADNEPPGDESSSGAGRPALSLPGGAAGTLESYR